MSEEDTVSSEYIPFNKPFMTGDELSFIAEAHSIGKLSGDGAFTIKCHQWLESQVCAKKALLTHSCTAALEMSALLLNIKEGDEVIMPSYTFVSTANAFVLRGAKITFVDIRFDTLNIDEKKIEQAITPNTKAIVPVHYAGVSCEMGVIMDIASRNNLFVIEDAAQGIMAKYKNKPLGSIGHLGAYSFHETKNVISGEGGALLINDQRFIKRAEIYREKGTDRRQFEEGLVDKYTWQDIGSSYLPGELVSAFLWAQLQQADQITQNRLDAWNYYHKELQQAESNELLRRPIIPADCEHNAHMYYVLLPRAISRSNVIRRLKNYNINAVFHYVSLHSSPKGLQIGRHDEQLCVTEDVSNRLLRLPLWVNMPLSHQERVVGQLVSIIKGELNLL